MKLRLDLNAAFSEFNRSLLDFFNRVDLQLTLVLLYDSLMQSAGLSGRLIEGYSSRERKLEFHAATVGLYYVHYAPEP